MCGALAAISIGGSLMQAAAAGRAGKYQQQAAEEQAKAAEEQAKGAEEQAQAELHKADFARERSYAEAELSFANARAAAYNAAIQRQNRQIALWQAADTIQRGFSASSEHLRKVRQLTGAQAATMAANGGLVGVGTNRLVVEGTRRIGRLDAARIVRNAERASYEQKLKAHSAGLRARLFDMTSSSHRRAGLTALRAGEHAVRGHEAISRGITKQAESYRRQAAAYRKGGRAARAGATASALGGLAGAAGNWYQWSR